MSWPRWGQLAGRRIPDRDRVRAFWICAGTLALAAAVLFSLPDSSAPPEGVPPGLEYGSAELPPSTSPPTATAEAQRAARRAARRFIPAYLAFLAGRGSAASLPATSPTLADRLADGRSRVSPAARTRRPRLVELDTRDGGAAAGLVGVTARISDGPITYVIELIVAHSGRRWLVSAVGSD